MRRRPPPARRVFPAPVADQRGTEQRVGSLEISQGFVNAPERPIELCLDRRLQIECARLAYAATQQGHDMERIGGSRSLVASTEHVQHELLDPLGPSGLHDGRGPRRREAHGVDRDEHHHRGQRGSSRGNAPPVPIAYFPARYGSDSGRASSGSPLRK